jgi:hypothetical protein
MNLYTMGMFTPERRNEALMCISLMDFDGKDEMLSRLREGAI